MTPSHHAPDGRFRNPWPGLPPEPGSLDFLRWMRERMREPRAPDPAPDRVPEGTPDVARPRLSVSSGEVRAIWIGHATFLVQLPGLNLLTDPVFSRRASPVQWTGPARFRPPGLALDELPPVDMVLLSHDHYDHLDDGSVRRLHERFDDAIAWFTPLGYRQWFGRRGVRRVVELDWWDEAHHQAPAGVDVQVRALPARHWTRRRMLDARRRLWSGWRVEAGGRRLYFAGDSGYCPAFTEIRAREEPFDLSLLPVGAYDPRWFMRASHMNPEEAVQAYQDLGGEGEFVGMHWGTFRLTDEDPMEPPERVRVAWAAAGLQPRHLHLPGIGGTVRC
ncbi:MAG TPA: MBL fold metallo-hydrolase [Longimicrobiales bacterium]|nr:MBL fold metallo-hydrolase [Longimicrobiales bacterium]